MKQEYLDFYNRELRLLFENAKEFAEEYPGVAERLGGLTAERIDPMIGGLLEGTALLAARVQLKLKHEFSEFTSNLLEQLVPQHQAPVPSAILVRIDPPFAEPKLKDGLRIEAGSYLEARYRERERPTVVCRFRTTEAITLWPLEITQADFIPTPAGFGFEIAPEIMSGMRITLTRRTAATRDLEPNLERQAQKPEHWISSCRISDLPIYILTGESEAIRIYEMVFARCRAVYVRYEDEFGDPVVLEMPRDCLRQVGLEPSEGLLSNDKRVFHGFDLLRELFIFPQKFLGFRLIGLDRVLPRVTARSAEVIFAFDRTDSRLASVVRAPIFSPYTAPAVNLFEMTTARIPIRSNEHEYQVIPDRSWQLGYEPLRILKVFAHLPGKTEKVEVYPLYSAPPSNVPTAAALFYTIRRIPRRQTVEERRFGRTSNYTGTDVFISLSGHAGEHGELGVAELSVRALCSNRHLTEHLPVGQGGADFILESNTSLAATCVAGPTNPRESIVSRAIGRDATVQAGTPAWRLISILSLNHLGLTGRGTNSSAEALREILSLFADTGDSATERRIRGILSIESRPSVRRIRRAEGAGAARGIEITITFDEKSYEGSGVYLFGAILERFFLAYAPINNFTETVIRSPDRGEIMRWPPRLGTRIEL